jgi:cytochrome c biogenesis protein CcmG, thiol:disulfide interchange protein DsbE
VTTGAPSPAGPPFDAPDAGQPSDPAPRGQPSPEPRASHRWTRRADRQLVGPFTGRHLLVVVATVTVVAMLLMVLNMPIAGPRPTSLPDPGATFVVTNPRTEGLAPGDRAPELRGTVDGQTVELTDLDGRPVRLADLRGRPVWLNFWASWCPPCQQETPVLRDVFEAHRDDGLALVAISVQETTADDVRRYAETYDLDYTIAFDATSAVFATYRCFGLPSQYFIDREGIIRDVVFGPLTQERAVAILAPLMAD